MKSDDIDKLIKSGSIHVSHTYCDGPVLVHRSDISNMANALINATSSVAEQRGIALLALALGCNVVSR